MIFKAKLARAITRGKKWQTRRPVKMIEADDNTRKLVEAPCRYRVGHDYALQTGRGKPALDGIRIRIIATRVERLGDLTEDDARAEGFKDTEEFFDYWRELYGDVDKAQRVYVITFDPVDEERALAVRPGEGQATGKADPFTGTRTNDYVPGAAGALKEAGGAVPEHYQEELGVRSRERWARHLESVASEEELRRQERHARNELRACLSGLDPLARQVLLAQIKALVEDARDAGERASEAAA